MYEQLTDAELIRRVREVVRARQPTPGRIAARALFYSDGEVALTAELQQRGMIDGDGQIRRSRKPHRHRVGQSKGA